MGLKMDDEILERLQVLDKRKKEANAELNKLDDMSWVAFLQLEESEERLKYFEKSQQNVFKNLIKKRHPELLPQLDDLFAEFFIDFLKEKVVSINDFLYEDRLAPVSKRALKQNIVPIEDPD